MGRLDELVSAEFAAWEQRGRGWQVWPNPVRPEPAFEEFTGYRLAQSQLEADDSRKPGFLASFLDSLERRAKPKPPVQEEETVEPEAVASEQPLTAEFVASLPSSLDIPEDTLRAFLDSLHGCAEPAGFELLGNHERVTIQFASGVHDAPALNRQLGAFLPKLAFTPTREALAEAWNASDGVGFIVDFGLAHEFMLPLATRHAVDPFVGLVAVLNELQQDEVAVFQVLFQPVQNPWAGSVWRSVTDANGKALFVNKLQLIPGTKAKLESPLFGVVVRVAAKAEDFDRAADIVRDMASVLRTFTQPEGNRLIPLTNDEYPFAAHEEDLTLRQSRRSGMLLNREELLGFVHLPSDEVCAPKLKRERTRTKAAPASALSPSGILLGHNRHAGRTTPVHLSAEQRVRHTHVIGASGKGKTTFLFNLIQQDIENGQGLAVLDPQGDLVERILGIIPPHRVNDVILLDPTDEAFSIGFNILSAHSDFEKTLLASDLVSVFHRLSTSWGDQLNSVLNNAIRAFLESSRGGTLADLQRFLIDAEFRNEFLQSVNDPNVVYYWRKSFPQLGGNKSIGPVLTRLDTFLGPKPIRYMVSQPANRLDFADILDSGKIFLARLPEGQIGKENAFLLGSLLVSKFQQMAMSRQRLAMEQRRDFWLYLDEFHNFITPSMAEILTGARKYRVGLILAHHHLQQLQRDSDVASAVMSNPHTRVVFGVGDSDAHALAKGFASFDAKDFQNLGIGEAIARLERSDGDFNLSIPLPRAIDESAAAQCRAKVIAASRQRYGTPRAEIEAALRKKMGLEEKTPVIPKPEVRKTEVPRPPPAQVSEPPKRAQVTEAPKRAEPPTMPKPSEPVPAKNVVVEVPNPPTPERATAAEKQPVQTPVVAEAQKTPKPELKSSDTEAEKEAHLAIKERIGGQAEGLDYTVTFEESVLDGAGRVDVVLRRGSRSIACEVSFTNTVKYEAGNVLKCLEAGFHQVAVVCQNRTKLAQIEQAVAESIQPAQKALVGYYLPDEFITCLFDWAAADPEGAVAERGKPRKQRITLDAGKLSDAERKEREKGMLAKLAAAMQRKNISG